MSERSFTAQDWHRVAQLRPRLRSNAGVSRQTFRGGLWYVLQDRGSGRFHRFSPEAWFLISLLDGERTVAEAWDIACTRLGDDAMTQGEVIRLLAQLHSADVLHGDVMPDVEEMLHRADRQRRRKLMMTFINPLAVRFPLIDPDAFLDATMPLVRPLFGWLGVLIFTGLVGYALVLLGIHWEAMTENIADRVLAADSLLLLIISYPIVKALHELGHGYAVKRWGGEVHEIGVMLLVFMPVPYVDASAAAAYPSKWRRALVGGAGILVELMLAAIAMIVWAHAEEGLVRAFAFSVMLIGGVSTLLFNGNPLLRFDGYYVLADLIEVPNLGQRANRYLGYLVQRYTFGIEGAEDPVTARGERKWLFGYAIAAFLYRLVIVAAIVLFVAKAFPFLGVVLAIWSLIMMFGVPLAKWTWFLLTSPKLRRRRGRALGVTAGTIAAVAALVTLVPLPHATLAEGVVWTPDEAGVYASQSGHVAEVVARPNAVVARGDVLLRLEDETLEAQIAALGAQVTELRYRLEAASVAEQSEARVLRERLVRAEGDLADARKALAELEVTSPADGRFILPSGDDLPGTWFDKGKLIGYVADFSDTVLIVAVPEQEADLVRSDTRAIDFRLADRMDRIYPARINRQVPQISETLPMAALSTVGGGALSVEPGSDPIRVLDPVLQLELGFDDALEIPALGGRAHVRFTHPDQPIAALAWRALRQLFLREFDV